MPLTGKYLKYSPEITLEIFTLVWNKLIENGCKFDYSKEIIFERFKFTERKLRKQPDGDYVYPLRGDNGCKETTVQEILGYDPFVKEEFVLPKKWFVKHNKIIGKWFDNKLSTYCYENSNFNYLYYPAHNDSHIFDTVLEDYTEITFEQFKKYVLKESVEKPKQQLTVFPSEGFCKADSVELRSYLKNKFPNCTQKNWNKKHTITAWNSTGYWWCEEKSGKPEYSLEQLKPFFNIEIPKESILEYVECIEGYSDQFTKGKIYKISTTFTNDYHYHTEIDDRGLPNGWSKNKFKPSTKEAFDAQIKPKSVEDKGFFVALQNNLISHNGASVTAGRIYKANLQFEFYDNNDNWICFLPDETNIKWFATKSEAEEFAKTLVEPVKLNELLVEAKRKYPIGTIYKYNGQNTVSDELKLSKHVGDINYISDGNGNCVWHQLEGWSEIISQPKQSLKNQAVHCKTQEEWDFVTEKLGNDGENWFKHADWGNNKSFCISFEGKNQSQTLDFYQKANYQILSFQEWCDLNGYKMEKEVKFEVGKWYKSNYFETEYYLKYDKTIREIDYNKIFYSILIKDGEIKENDYIAYTALEKSFNLLTDLSEIQQHLPDDHPDKIKSNDFKVGDWVVVVKSKSRFSDINRAIGYIFQIREDGSYYEEFMKGFDQAIDGDNKYCINYNKSNIPHATPNEINNHLISIGQIPDLIKQESEKYPFKPLKPGDLEWEIQVPQIKTHGIMWCEPILMTRDNWKHKMILSIDDEELPMVSIIKTNTIKQLLNND